MMNCELSLYPLKFKQNLYQLVWGGDKICKWKQLQEQHECIGESWEISAVGGKESVISNGALEGMTLSDAVKKYGGRLVGKRIHKQYGDTFPLLAKFIDAAKDLSIQVHPDDELARERHGKLGKNEMWLIISAEPGARIYSGFKHRITKEEYRRHVEEGTICEVLQEHEAHPGDIFYIPAGRVHAIGAGILLAEIQQSSDVTYRIFDYNRLGLDGKPRELHTDLAVDAIDFGVSEDYRTHYTLRSGKPTHVITCPFFQINILDFKKKTHRHLRRCDSFIIYMCTKGECTISVEGTTDEASSITLREGESCLLPAECANHKVSPLTPSVRLLEAFIEADATKPLFHRIKKRLRKLF